jgi:hypothetical protein
MLKKILFLGNVFLLFAAINASAVTINLWDIFPKTTQGENGISIYGRNLSTSADRELRNDGNYRFDTDANYWIPLAYRSSEDTSSIIMHPSNAEDIVLAYKPSETNTYTISGAFNPVTGSNIEAYIYKNSESLWSQILNSKGTFNLEDIYLSTDDTLYFGVSAYNGDVNDTTVFSASLTDDRNPVATPEPASILLLSIGIGGLALMKFRQKKA